MIGTFWNLCRACPNSMPLDKLHSEYRSTYRWHEYTGGPDVVRKPPVPNQFAIIAPINEPPLPRRKKCPELAYRHHEFISAPDSGVDRVDSAHVTRARSGERTTTPSRRSKSEGPPGLPNGRIVASDHVNEENKMQNKEKAGESSGGQNTNTFRKTISKLSTEYRLQFVWPNVRRAITGSSNNRNDDNHILLEPPRKSQSMGALKASQSNTLAGIHKKRTTNEKEATVHELEPLVLAEADEKPSHEKHFVPSYRKDMHNEYKKNTRTAFHSEKEKFGFEQDIANKIDNKIANGHAYDNAWYKEVLELRKKAGEYRNRGWGGETHRDLYNKQVELWDQVSRRSSLSALSLASSIRPISKEEKDKENNKKSSPTKPSGRGRVPGSARLVDNRTVTDGNLYGRLKRETMRHHLERTTGPDVEEGALLPSPTREKLMPAIPRSKADSGSPQRGSPQKTASSRHGSPHKGSPQKSPKKLTKVGRSQSVGPTVTESVSPKRQPKPMSSSVTASTASSSAKTHTKRTPVSTPTSANVDRRPRPTTLSTTNKNHSRSKSSTLPVSGRQKPSTLNIHSNANTLISSSLTPSQKKFQLQNNTPSASQNSQKNVITNKNTLNNTNQARKSGAQSLPNKTIENKNIQNKQLKLNNKTTNFIGVLNDNSLANDRQLRNSKKKALEIEDGDKDGGGSISSASPCPPQIPDISMIEQIIKSPPEPTRVKSPEQIIMRSPDPVNWTVPLDTGKTFTVTQNVRDGDIANIVRPHSEIKVSTPSEPPTRLLPQAPQSAPPELSEQDKLDALIDNEPSSSSSTYSKPSQPEAPRFDRPVPGSTLRCLEDPVFDADINSPSSSNRNAVNPSTDELEKARDRFDRFWGNPNEEQK
ncbi:unnamed protein product [Diamesa tonsa]